MKKILFILFSCYSFSAMAMDTVTVNTVEQLLDSIQSNRLILVEPGIYDLSESLHFSQLNKSESLLDEPLGPNTFYTSDVGVIVNQVKNMTISGLGETMELSQFITGLESDNVLSFSGCSNIKLVNLTLQYDPTKSGNRKGGALYLNQCSNIKAENVKMARGEVGLSIVRSKGIEINQGLITECSSGTVWLIESWSVKVLESTIEGNRACASMWKMVRCTDVKIRGNTFLNNRKKESRKCANGKMFAVSRCEILVIKGNTIKGNDFQYLGDSETVRKIQSDNFMKRNKFVAMIAPLKK